MAPKQARRTNCLSTKLVPVIILVPWKQSNSHAVCLFGIRYVPPRHLLAPPNVWKLKKYSILAPGSLSASFHQGGLPRHLLIFFFLWFSDCVGFCQIEQRKPVEKHHKRRDALIWVGEQMPHVHSTTSQRLYFMAKIKGSCSTLNKRSQLWELIRGEKCQTHFEFELNNQDPYFPAATRSQFS